MKALRTTMRRRRAAVPAAEIAANSLTIARRLWRIPALARCRRIACYMAVDGEVDCMPFMLEALARGRFVYLPVVSGRTLLFSPWQPQLPMVANRFGIPEPAGDGGRWLRGSELDVVLAPLVAFDDGGRRLGMGGGFYDRTFRFLAQRERWRRPHFLGVAHEFQRVTALPSRSWDLKLHAVITELNTRFF